MRDGVLNVGAAQAVKGFLLGGVMRKLVELKHCSPLFGAENWERE